jgi:hypothetical protein
MHPNRQRTATKTATEKWLETQQTSDTQHTESCIRETIFSVIGQHHRFTTGY